jgi:hypothetical protein
MSFLAARSCRVLRIFDLMRWKDHFSISFISLADLVPTCSRSTSRRKTSPGTSRGRTSATIIFFWTAERVRKLGGTTLRSIGHISPSQRVLDNDADFVTSLDMLAELRDDNKQLAANLRETNGLCDDRRHGERGPIGDLDRRSRAADVVPVRGHSAAQVTAIESMSAGSAANARTSAASGSHRPCP